MSRTCLAVLVLIVGVRPLAAVSPDPKSLAVPSSEQAHARELVQQLGSEQFAERETAEQSLAAMGRLARASLLEGLNTSPNAEIRSRCEGLLPKATALELKARLEVFLADVDGKYEHELPGWTQFRAKVCNERKLFGFVLSADKVLERAARSVFVELISTPANKAVVMATSASENELNATVIARRQELTGLRPGRIAGGGISTVSRREVGTEDVAALLFAESLAPQTASRVPRQASASLLMRSSGFTSHVLDTDDKGRVYKAIAAAWFDSRTNPLDLYQGMSLAGNMGLKAESLRMAARLLATQGGISLYRTNAASVLAASGGKEHIPLLEKAFEDAGVLNPVRAPTPDGEWVSRDLQVRDVALSLAIQFSGQSPVDYGFTDTSSGGLVGVSYNRFFLPEKQRTAAFNKWKEWRAKSLEKP